MSNVHLNGEVYENVTNALETKNQYEILFIKLFSRFEAEETFGNPEGAKVFRKTIEEFFLSKNRIEKRGKDGDSL